MLRVQLKIREVCSELSAGIVVDRGQELGSKCHRLSRLLIGKSDVETGYTCVSTHDEEDATYGV
jgi:hypothetical protein